jgi:DNA-binding NarL/FixJ family response regulator
MRVMLADERPEVRSALRLLLEQDPGVVVMGEAAEAADVLSQVEEACPDLVLLDWDLPGSRPTDLLAALRSICPDLVVTVLSSRPGRRRLALSAGADAFVSKGDSPELLLAVLRHCADLSRVEDGARQCHGKR